MLSKYYEKAESFQHLNHFRDAQWVNAQGLKLVIESTQILWDLVVKIYICFVLTLLKSVFSKARPDHFTQKSFTYILTPFPPEALG